MIEKFRKIYKEKLWVKIVTVTLVVIISVAVMLPIVKIAELFGINFRDNASVNFKVTFSYIFFFFLLGVCTITTIWLAQKYIHKKSLSELGLSRKIWLPAIIGFVIGTIIFSLKYFILYLNGASLTFTKVISEDVTLITYLGYYLYFFFGFIFWNSFIEEIGMRAYPIQKLKNHINPYIIFTIMGLIFTIGHFFLNDFSLVYFLSLFMYSYIFSLVYYYSNSIWFVVGIHSGSNWVAFSFFGNNNWKLGGLYNTKIIGDQSWTNDCIYLIILFVILLLIVFLSKKGIFRKYFPISNEVSNKLN
jgi:membrane protease YdiL (CAAX protease family)